MDSSETGVMSASCPDLEGLQISILFQFDTDLAEMVLAYAHATSHLLLGEADAIIRSCPGAEGEQVGIGSLGSRGKTIIQHCHSKHFVLADRRSGPANNRHSTPILL